MHIVWLLLLSAPPSAAALNLNPPTQHTSNEKGNKTLIFVVNARRLHNSRKKFHFMLGGQNGNYISRQWRLARKGRSDRMPDARPNLVRVDLMPAAKNTKYHKHNPPQQKGKTKAPPQRDSIVDTRLPGGR